MGANFSHCGDDELRDKQTPEITFEVVLWRGNLHRTAPPIPSISPPISFSSSSSSYYNLLGVHRTASAEQIKEAYREKALKWHPDKLWGQVPRAGANSEQYIWALNEAFAVLRDPKLRSIYDFGGEKAVAEQRQRREKVEQQLEMSRRATAVELPALSVLMHRIGRGVEWEEILAAIRFNDAQLPRAPLAAVRGDCFGCVVDAIERAFSILRSADTEKEEEKERGFRCAFCNRQIAVGIDGICYCPKAAGHLHCNTAKCCPYGRGAAKKRGPNIRHQMLVVLLICAPVLLFLFYGTAFGNKWTQ